MDKMLKTPELCHRILLNLASIYPMRLHWSTLSGKRTNFYTYLATAQKTKYAVVPIHTEEKFHLFSDYKCFVVSAFETTKLCSIPFVYYNNM